MVVPDVVSSSIADIGGLVARGEGTAAGKPNDAEGPRLKPRFGIFVVTPDGGGPEAEGPGVAGAVPLLNSAHRGHLRFVSNEFVSMLLITKRYGRLGMTMIMIRLTHMTHLPTMTTSPLR